MARKQEVIVHLVDDIDGSTAVETVSFGIDGATYEIDVNKRNAKAIRSDFEKWAVHAHKPRAKSRATRRRAGAPKPSSEAATIRTWAAEHGIEVPPRGRIPKAVLEQYQAS